MARRILCGLDVGSTRVTAVVGEAGPEGTPRIVGVGEAVARGLRRGVIADVEEVASSVEHATREAARMAGVPVHTALLAVGGPHVELQPSRAVVAVSGRDREVSAADVERALMGAREVPVAAGKEVIHLLLQEFVVDGVGRIKDPVDMKGSRLEARVLLVTVSRPFVQNLLQCVRRAELEVDALVLAPLAAGEAVLTEEEREMGVLLVDIGGSGSTITSFSGGTLVYTETVPIGGQHLTTDLAVGLRCSVEEAERIKCEEGRVTESGGDDPLSYRKASGVGEQVPRSQVVAILRARLEEIFQLLRERAARAGILGHVPAGVVLTGGGSQLEGAGSLAEAVFDLPVRRGYPFAGDGLADIIGHPRFAVPAGLLYYAASRGLLAANGLWKGLFSSWRWAEIFDRVRALVRGMLP